ncbi:hypothetical protein [Stackebrandtia soli]|uniref:hypothetical protein n=1 Tax=Stackebrandtia soli TaxID=1892856 RepID=UPI0039EB1D95
MVRASASARHTSADDSLRRARDAMSGGDRPGAVSILDGSLRSGLWDVDAVWLEFTALPHDTGDYPVLRSLWWDSPRRCHRSQAVVLTVARSAAIAGVHDDARLLMRKAILARRAARGGLAARVRSLLPRRPVAAAMPGPGIEPRDREAAATLLFFGLHHALGADGTAEERARLIAALAEIGEGDWLTRVG